MFPSIADLITWLVGKVLKPFTEKTGEKIVGKISDKIADKIANSLEPNGSAGGISKATIPTVVFKGLRAFNKHDASFYLDLLPGSRGPDGLPECVRFWKYLIEETDPYKTFKVGLLYGPSGCGKSSLMEAGIIPNLGDSVIPVYIEAIANETEIRLLNTLRKSCSTLPPKSSLLSTLQKKNQIPEGKKLLIVLDQFEQWLHAHCDINDAELLHALKECDGERVQCVVMVRDDFWSPVSRFLKQLGIQQQEGRNMQMVDLFDRPHARKVLAAFGKAFGSLGEEQSKEHSEFVDRAVDDLAQENKVICVRLALFAQMVKGKPWTPVAFREAGGTEGLGVAFLEETFSTGGASPGHRYHQKAVRGVLKALLPPSGTNIKGQMRSDTELLHAAGYGIRQNEFDDLIRILDTENRLITLTDINGKVPDDTLATEIHPGRRYYQLTHDYLVPLLREWLNRKQKETRRGRAELLLADRAMVWNARPENRQLPSLLQWLAIRWWTPKKNWMLPERKLMAKSARYHLVRVASLAALLAVATAIGLATQEHFEDQRKMSRAIELVRNILDAESDEVDLRIAAITKADRERTFPLLQMAYAEAKKAYNEANSEEEKSKQARKQLRASLGLLPTQPEQKEYLFSRLLDADFSDVRVTWTMLRPHQAGLTDRLWEVFQDSNKKGSARLRAACALACADSPPQTGDGRWAHQAPFVVGQLLDTIEDNHSLFNILRDLLRPVCRVLKDPLFQIHGDRDRPVSERILATDLLTGYYFAEPSVLVDLALDPNLHIDQMSIVLRIVKQYGHEQSTIDKCDHMLGNRLNAQGDREVRAKKQANAAVVLVHLGQWERVWHLLNHDEFAVEGTDPRVRSYLIDRLGMFKVDHKPLVECLLHRERPVSVRRGLLLAIGGFSEDLSSKDDHLSAAVVRAYSSDPDPGVHSAAEWLLRQWGRDEAICQLQQTWKDDKKGRESRIREICGELTTGKNAPRWYVNCEGQTLVVIPVRGKFKMGSPPEENGRPKGVRGKFKDLRDAEIAHAFAITAKEVTVGDFQNFWKGKYGTDLPRDGKTYSNIYSPSKEYPINKVSWVTAAEYCNWLSEKEGFEKYYLFGADGQIRFSGGSGYRLPLETEWEYACRAGAMTSRYYGDSEELLGKYARYIENSRGRGLVIGGTLKPNDFGLFDMLGNTLEWCHDPSPESGDRRILRGGSHLFIHEFVRSACRLSEKPSDEDVNYGFRVAKTFR